MLERVRAVPGVEAAGTTHFLPLGGVTRVLRSLLFGVTPTDAITFFTVAAILSAIAFAGTCMPARRALTVDPIAALLHG